MLHEAEGMEISPTMFSHSPLDERHTQIRLVTVDRRKKDSKAIHLYLKAHNMDTIMKTSYFAISYTWGPEDDLREIF